MGAGSGAITQSARTLLLVDDNDDSRTVLRWFLENFGYVVQSTRGVREALGVFDPRVHDVVVTDNAMPGVSGCEMAHIIKLRSPDTPVVMYSGEKPTDTTCLDEVVLKPSHLLTLKDALDKVLGRAQLSRPS